MFDCVKVAKFVIFRIGAAINGTFMAGGGVQTPCKVLHSLMHRVRVDPFETRKLSQCVHHFT